MAAIVDSGFVSINTPSDFDGIYVNWVTGVRGTPESSGSVASSLRISATVINPHTVEQPQFRYQAAIEANRK